MSDLTMFGYPARVVLDLPGGPHDISSLVEVAVDLDGSRPLRGFVIDAETLLREIAVETRARERADGVNDGVEAPTEAAG